MGDCNVLLLVLSMAQHSFCTIICCTQPPSSGLQRDVVWLAAMLAFRGCARARPQQWSAR